MYNYYPVKNDLDVSKVRYVYSDTVIYDFDSVVVSKATNDISFTLHAATGSRQTYMLKNDGWGILSIYISASDVIDTDITCIDLFPYESILIMDSSPGNWHMLDFHLLWFFRKMEL